MRAIAYLIAAIVALTALAGAIQLLYVASEGRDVAARRIGETLATELGGLKGVKVVDVGSAVISLVSSKRALMLTFFDKTYEFNLTTDRAIVESRSQGLIALCGNETHIWIGIIKSMAPKGPVSILMPYVYFDNGTGPTWNLWVEDPKDPFGLVVELSPWVDDQEGQTKVYSRDWSPPPITGYVGGSGLGYVVNEGAGCDLVVKVARVVGEPTLKLWVGGSLAVNVDRGDPVVNEYRFKLPGNSRIGVDYFISTEDPVSGVEIEMTPIYIGIPLTNYRIFLGLTHYMIDGEIGSLKVGPGFKASFTTSKGSIYIVEGSKRLLAYERGRGLKNIQDYLKNWRYYKIMDVRSLYDLNNYVILMLLDTATPISKGKMRSDLGDLRFIDRNSRSLSWWAEPESINTRNTRVWVKIDLQAGSNKIYMFYGNPSATYTQDPNRVFLFFDDFDNLNRWSTGSGGLDLRGAMKLL